MSHFQEPDSHIRDKVRVTLDLSNYATIKQINDATGVDTFNTFTAKEFSETRPVMHLSKHVFGSI